MLLRFCYIPIPFSLILKESTPVDQKHKNLNLFNLSKRLHVQTQIYIYTYLCTFIYQLFICVYYIWYSVVSFGIIFGVQRGWAPARTKWDNVTTVSMQKSLTRTDRSELSIYRTTTAKDRTKRENEMMMNCHDKCF